MIKITQSSITEVEDTETENVVYVKIENGEITISYNKDMEYDAVEMSEEMFKAIAKLLTPTKKKVTRK